MKRTLTSFLLLSLSLFALAADRIAPRAEAADGGTEGVRAMLQRILPNAGDADRFTLELVAAEETSTATNLLDRHPEQRFTLSSDGEKVHVQATDAVALAAGVGWFLQHHAGVSISWNSPTGHLPKALPIVDAEEHEASVDYRYYLNFCTHSYTMAFWDWQRWEQEIDWMALHGINLPLVITGMECVWREVLREGYGYDTLAKVNEFVCGSAYYGWFFMNNLTAWGGPQTESWYTGRLALARKIFARMKEFGMSPVVPGYVGMVPKNFLSYADKAKVADWKASDIVNGGSWNSFERPYFVNNTARLKEFAAQYYDAFQRLFGDVCGTHFYAIDPFHEGGVPSGVTSAQASIKAMYDALVAYDSDAVWVCQHWQDNPSSTLTRTIPLGRLLILDLHGDNQGDTSCSGNHTATGGKPHYWVWGQVSNFGGNVGLFGRIDRLINCFYAARDAKDANALVGIGAIPEGIENNGVLYDLLYALPWTTENYTRDSWAADYVKMRYGIGEDSEAYAPVLSAWQQLCSDILNCPTDRQQGTTESVFLMRPALKAGTVSSWANSSWYWDAKALRAAVRDFLSAAPTLQDNDNYRYDLVDLMRQTLADLGKETLDSIAATTGTERAAIAERFLGLILDQDRLLGTRQEFRLGRWTSLARSWGETAEEKDLQEKNARMLLTTWGDRAQCETGGLHDYANREWQGLLSSYYYPRWHAFFSNNYRAQSWFAAYEWPFATGNISAAAQHLPDGAAYAYGTFSAQPEGDEVQVAQELWDKYFADFRPEVWEQCVPDLNVAYTLTNATQWYGAPDTEGLNLTAPNSDYNGYRLKRSALVADDESYLWRFIASDTHEGAVKVENVLLSARQPAQCRLAAKPSTAAYPAFTFSRDGSDFLLFTNGEAYYLKAADEDLFMSPDCAWREACVLISGSRSETSLLHLTRVETGIHAPSLTASPASSAAPLRHDLLGRRLPAHAHQPKGIMVEEAKKVLR